MNKHKNHGILHCHSEYSMFDGTMKVNTLAKKAKELDAPFVTLTDHGTLLGIPSFMAACREENIKGIPGVEAYFEEENDFIHHGHLLLIAKNWDGYIAIGKCVTQSNMRMDNGFPLMNLEILYKNLGPGSKGFNNVICCTACVGGVFSQILLTDDKIREKQHKLRSIQQNDKCCPPNAPEYIALCDKLNKYQAELNDISAEIKSKTELSKRTYKLELRSLKKFEGEEHDKLQTALNAKMARSEAAKKELPMLQKKKKELNTLVSEMKTKIKKYDAKIEKYNKTEAEIQALEDEKIGPDNAVNLAEQRLLQFIDIFGKDNIFMEMQYHGLTSEINAFTKLKLIAKKLGIRLVVSNDAHIMDNSEDEITKRHMLSTLRYCSRWEAKTPDLKEYYIKDDEQLKKATAPILNDEEFEECLRSLDYIDNVCTGEWNHELHYPKYIVSGREVNAEEELRQLSEKNIPLRYGSNFTDEHRERLNHELDVICSMGYADYTLIVQEYVNYGRSIGAKWRYNVGIRGSGAASIVNYLTGITNLDPMKYDLLFERYLNPERVSMPDIDIDMATTIREDIYEHVKHIRGDMAVCKISTVGTQLPNKCIRNTARILGLRDTGNSKEYNKLADAICKSIPSEGECWSSLKEQWKDNEKASEIIQYAPLLENTPIQLSTHAAGVIISDNDDVSDYVPLRYDEDAGWACQCDMVEAEKDMGLLKMDFLGSITLDVISECNRLIYERHGYCPNLDELPLEKAVFDMLSSGLTNGVFQLESDGMKDILTKFKPTCFEDIILILAAYRPGPMQYIPKIIDVKNKVKEPEYLIPQLKPILETTYGYPIYQEQIISIFHEIAGFSLGEADIIRRHMSKKHTEEFLKYHGKTIAGFIKSGMTEEQAEAFWTELIDFSKYAFNKGHAASYAKNTYITAWQKCYYPIEFYTATLCYCDNSDKIKMYVQEAKNKGIKFLAPDINRAGCNYEIVNDSIMLGFSAISGLNSQAELIVNARNMHSGWFRDFNDYCEYGVTDKVIMEHLIYVGAFDSLCDNRAALLSVLPEVLSYKETEKKAVKNLQVNPDSEKDVVELRNARNAIANIILPVEMADIQDRYEQEFKNVGFYITGHPLDMYPDPKQCRCKPLNRLTVGKCSVLGIISSIKECNTKKSEQMAFFTLEDKISAIDCVAFPSVWSAIKQNIYDGAVIKLSGRCEKRNDKLQIIVDKIEKVHKQPPQIIMCIPNLIAWQQQIYLMAKVYEKDEGLPLILYDRSMGEFRTTTMKLDEKIVGLGLPNVTIRIYDPRKNNYIQEY